jgi:hypothetical protein
VTPLQVAVHLVPLVAGSVQGQVVPGRSSESGLFLQNVPAQQAAAMFGHPAQSAAGLRLRGLVHVCWLMRLQEVSSTDLCMLHSDVHSCAAVTAEVLLKYYLLSNFGSS